MKCHLATRPYANEIGKNATYGILPKGRTHESEHSNMTYSITRLVVNVHNYSLTTYSHHTLTLPAVRSAPPAIVRIIALASVVLVVKLTAVPSGRKS